MLEVDNVNFVSKTTKIKLNHPVLLKLGCVSLKEAVWDMPQIEEIRK